jgi:Amt family ammonium transporter
MYPASFWNGILPDYFVGLFGLESPIGKEGLDLAYNEGYTYWTDFLFQGMFAATAATIVSGAVAERAKLGSFFVFSILLIGLAYPLVGSWKWGGGFLDEWGFYDFAGSTLVHSVGGWAALLYIMKLGARIGKFDKDGKARAIPGHNLPFAAAGVLILWLGWFGFNGGSVLSADPGLTSLVLTTTSIAAAAGGLAAAGFVHIVYKNFDLTMFMNGILGGLVSITAGADLMGITDAILIGALGGVIVVLAVSLLDKLKLDDPVGAVAVHLGTGIWGTLAVGLFGSSASTDQFLIQLTGVGIVAAFCITFSWVVLTLIEKIWGLRVVREEELDGLDQAEHGGMTAYADFRMNQH